MDGGVILGFRSWDLVSTYEVGESVSNTRENVAVRCKRRRCE